MLGRRLLASARGLGSFWSVRNMVNVTAYGAVGNGTADDTSAINAAIAATPAGGTCYFPAGNYKITSRLTVDANPIRLLGDGQGYGGTTITQATANTDALGFDLDNLSSYSPTGTSNNRNYEQGSAVEHMRIHGPTGGTDAAAGAGIYGLSDVSLFAVTTYGFNTGLFLDSKSFFAHAVCCKFATATDQAVMHRGYNFTLFDCQMWNSAYGLWLSGNQNIRVRDCVFEQNATAGLFYDGALQGALTAAPSSLVVSGCYFEETASGTPDIKIGSTTAVSDIVIEGNIFIDNAQGDTGASWHIDLYKADRVTISTNTLTGGGSTGGDIRCSANTTNVALLNQRYVTLSNMPATTVYLASPEP